MNEGDIGAGGKGIQADFRARQRKLIVELAPINVFDMSFCKIFHDDYLRKMFRLIPMGI